MDRLISSGRLPVIHIDRASRIRLADLSTHVVSYDGYIFVRWMGNSILHARVGAAVGALIATMAGYALAKYRFPGSEVFFNVVLGGVLVPATALALPLFLPFSEVSTVSTVNTYGASEFRAFFTVALRLLAPTLVTIYLFQFVGIWNNFFLPSQAPGLRIYIVVGALLSIIPLVLAFLSLQRFWQSGLAAGGVK